ncbi:hypothetical protein ACHAXS_000284, partial [Conticribra weissflogii]
MASGWNRTTQYKDLIENSRGVSSMPIINRSEERLVVIFHCSPKTGSTTLRLACKKNLETTCGLVTNSRRDPYAYMMSNEFFSMVRSCNKTNYFCAKDIKMLFDIPAFDDVHFIHVFPFRNYDEWAQSAMKQIYSRSPDKECELLRDKYINQNCTYHYTELDFRQYSKTGLAKYKEFVIRRMNEKNENHS